MIRLQLLNYRTTCMLFHMYFIPGGGNITQDHETTANEWKKGTHIQGKHRYQGKFIVHG